VPARDPSVAPVGEVAVGSASGAFLGRVNGPGGEAGAKEGGDDDPGKVERVLPAGAGAKMLGGEQRRDFRPDLEAAGVEAGTHGGEKRPWLVAEFGEPHDGGAGDFRGGAAPARMHHGGRRGVARHDGDRRAVGGGDSDPGVSPPGQDSVGRAGRLAGQDQAASVLLVEAARLVRVHAEPGADARPILPDAGLVVPDAEAEVERGERPFARTPQPRRQAEPDSVGEEAGRRAPVERGVGIGEWGLKRHPAQRACSIRTLQAVCTLVLLAGCARAPAVRGPAEVRARLLDRAGEPEVAARGAGTVTWIRDGKKLGSADLRWASAEEGVAVVASVGPVRGLAAALRGDSLAVALRRTNLYISGAINGGGGSDARLLRFLVEPWRLGRGWARGALARAHVEPCDGGYCLIGAPEEDPRRLLRLVVNARAEPVSFSVPVREGSDERVEVRYGKLRRYAAGRLPRWVEWSWGNSRARISIDAHWAADPGLRLWFRPDAEDTVYTLEQPRGRAILRAFFDLPKEEEAP
jgi:hypothetical protein